jgi:hypothetical protein
MIFASRDAESITPTQSDVDLYFDRWTRAVEAEPILGGRIPQRHRSDTGVEFSFETAKPAIVSAFRSVASADYRPVPITGDVVFDEIMTQLVAPQTARDGNETQPGSFLFPVYLGATFNEELVAARLLETDAHLPDPVQHYRDDGTWIWPNGLEKRQATAQIDFTFGWGDCFVACEGLHELRVFVPPTGTASIFDLGGDPLPPFLVLDPNTMPLPQ